MASTILLCNKESGIHPILSSADENKAIENDFLETIENNFLETIHLLEMDADEISDKISCSIEGVSLL